MNMQSGRINTTIFRHIDSILKDKDDEHKWSRNKATSVLTVKLGYGDKMEEESNEEILV